MTAQDRNTELKVLLDRLAFSCATAVPLARRPVHEGRLAARQAGSEEILHTGAPETHGNGIAAAEIRMDAFAMADDPSPGAETVFAERYTEALAV